MRYLPVCRTVEQTLGTYQNRTGSGIADTMMTRSHNYALPEIDERLLCLRRGDHRDEISFFNILRNPVCVSIVYQIVIF
jgi:hypothetical protein